MSHPRLTEDDLAELDRRLDPVDTDRLRQYPGESTGRQPVHTVYVPADRYTPDLPQRWGAEAAATLARHAARDSVLADVIGADHTAVREVWGAMVAKLESEPIEDLRVDLEDGYGRRPDDVEDADALATGSGLGAAMAAGTAPPFLGVRFKSLEGSTRRRGLRSLDLVLAGLLEVGPLPPGWLLTLPKVTAIEQVEAMVEVCRRLERAYGLAAGSLHFEIQVETPQAILLPDGTAGVARMIRAAEGRCRGLHYGTYDYSAALGVAGGYQALDHPVADHAKAVMQLAAAGTGIRLSDGSTNVLPVGERDRVHQAWALHARLVRRSLERGFYQGWDLHPAQLPTRYLATYLFFRTGLEQVTCRLRDYLTGAVGGVLDEPATAQALARFLVRGVHCGAVGPEEAATLTATPLSAVEEIAGRRLI